MIIAHQKPEILLFHANVLTNHSKARGKRVQEINPLEASQENLELQFHSRRKTILLLTCLEEISSTSAPSRAPGAGGHLGSARARGFPARGRRCLVRHQQGTWGCRCLRSWGLRRCWPGSLGHGCTPGKTRHASTPRLPRPKSGDGERCPGERAHQWLD